MNTKQNQTGVMIILYNPEIERLKRNLDSITKQSSNILCIDNGSENIQQIETLLASYENVSILKNADNKGIAAALNQGMSYWEEKGMQWVLSLDQDSVCSEDFLEKLEAYKDYRADIAVVCPVIADQGQGRLESGGVADEQEKHLKWIDYTITSGSLMSVEKWNLVGRYDEVLFIDFVDTDICKRFCKAGMKILENGHAVLEHQIGDTIVKHILGRTFYVRNHSPFRKYYIIRNDIYLYHKGEQTLKNLLKFIIREYILVLLFEQQKWKKICQMTCGIRDGRKMK